MNSTEATQPLGLVSSAQLGQPAPEWAIHLAAQCWCEPTTSMIEMDSRLALVFAAKLAAERERCAKVCEAEAENWRGEQDIIDFKLCAARIRSGA